MILIGTPLCTRRPWKPLWYEPGMRGESCIWVCWQRPQLKSRLWYPSVTPLVGVAFNVGISVPPLSPCRWEHTDFLSWAHSVHRAHTSTLLLQNRVLTIRHRRQPHRHGHDTCHTISLLGNIPPHAESQGNKNSSEHRTLEFGYAGPGCQTPKWLRTEAKHSAPRILLARSQ